MNIALLEQRMAELKLKPVDVASRLGCSEACIRRILRGTVKQPKPLTIRALATLLEVEQEALFTAPKRRAG